ncbi:MAG: DUF3726 domain-containing protein [Roseovarius sp.]
MSWSLSEIEGLARKAAKGAGYAWGMAEEAGKSVRFLCAAGLPGAEALAGLLQLNDTRDYAAYCPDCTQDIWSARTGPLCPVVTGAALCDRATELGKGTTITLKSTSFPLLLLPAIASASDLADAPLSLQWNGLRMTRADRETWIETTAQAQNPAEKSDITITRSTSNSGTRVRRGYRGEIAPDVTEILNVFAHRTYAPDTPESRLSGAGAGLTDND